MSRFGAWALLLAAWAVWNPLAGLAAQAVAGIASVGTATPPAIWTPPQAVLAGLLLALFAAEAYCAWSDCWKL